MKREVSALARRVQVLRMHLQPFVLCRLFRTHSSRETFSIPFLQGHSGSEDFADLLLEFAPTLAAAYCAPSSTSRCVRARLRSLRMPDSLASRVVLKLTSTRHPSRH